MLIPTIQYHSTANGYEIFPSDLGWGKGDAFAMRPTDLVRQTFDKQSRVRGIFRVVTMIRSGPIVDLPVRQLRG